MLSWTTALLFLAGWISFWYLFPFTLSFFLLNHYEDSSVITGEPLLHQHHMPHRTMPA
jgi:Sec-independent protein secretion pathway component TatC